MHKDVYHCLQHSVTYDVTERKEDDFLVIAESEKIHQVVFSKAAEFLILFFR